MTGFIDYQGQHYASQSYIIDVSVFFLVETVTVDAFDIGGGGIAATLPTVPFSAHGTIQVSTLNHVPFISDIFTGGGLAHSGFLRYYSFDVRSTVEYDFLPIPEPSGFVLILPMLFACLAVRLGRPLNQIAPPTPSETLFPLKFAVRAPTPQFSNLISQPIFFASLPELRYSSDCETINNRLVVHRTTHLCG